MNSVMECYSGEHKRKGVGIYVNRFWIWIALDEVMRVGHGAG